MTTYTQQNHAQQLGRSNSFFGAIKNIVTAPFTWFAGSDDEFEDTKGKRRRLPVTPEDTHMEDDSLPSRPKRMRVDTPDRDTQPYLDPPRSTFAQPRRPPDYPVSSLARDVTRSPRKTLHIPSSLGRLPHSRRTLSPLPSSSHLKPQGVVRTMSLDPPSNSSFSSRTQGPATAVDATSDPNRDSHSMPLSREVSMSPRHLRVRSSLTPQPSGSSFGPVVRPRRERGPDEPPPLTALMTNPMFVKPPPAPQKQGTADHQKQLTLGTLLDSQRSARPLARQSSILFGTGSMTDVSARHLWPVNKAEVALHELEVYKTPLLPTRLKGATVVPDMFVHKEKKHITLMTDDRPLKPRLGTKSKGKEKARQKERETMNGTKPYAGEGGMKKWLARRKKEEEEAKEKERAEAMEDERQEEEKKHKEAESQKRREEELNVPPPPPAPLFEPRASREGPLSSSLRVGRTRTGRNHIERPISRRPKFSAAFEDEDEDMEDSRATEQKVLEEAAKKAPVFEIPAGFTFAQETAITHDLTRAREPPITSLPFSLTKSAPSPPAAETAKAIPVPVPPTPAPAQPQIVLVPPTPETVRAAPETQAPPTAVTPVSNTTSAGIPNFFASSSVFAKSTAATSPSSLLAVPVVDRSKPAEVPKPDVPKANTPLPLSGAPSQPPSMFAAPSPGSMPTTSVFGGSPALSKEAEKPTTPTPSLAPPFAFGAPAKPVESVAAPTPALFKQPATTETAPPTAPSNGTPFTFGAPPAPSPAPVALPAPAASTEAPAPIPAATAEPPKSAFSFGQSAPATTSSPVPSTALSTAPPTTDAPKSIFSAPAPPTASFSFGQRTSTATAEEKPATSPFSFAASSTAEKKPATGFSFGTSTTSTAAPATSTAFSFSTAPSGTAAADVSTKPFAFGSATLTPARPVTPPKAVQEVTMDESPARDMASGNGNSKAPERPTLNFSFGTPSGSALFAQSPATATGSFSFGASGATTNPFAKDDKKESKPAVSFSGFGQASSGFSFGQKPAESPAVTTTAPAFSFSQASPSVAPPSPFTFGPAPLSAGPFGQTSATSAPSSPSAFSRPAPFAFGTPSTTTQPPASPFAFGASSQPASPATGNTTLPPGTAGNTPFTFGAGANATTTPGVGFGAPAASPAAGSLFTMGSAPPPAEAAGSRRIKGLPRRGARR